MNNRNKLNCILLIDDDSINNFLNQKISERLDITSNIRIATNGAKAIEFIKESIIDKCCPQLIFLDLNMPIMNGFEFLEAYNNLSFTIRIVILTSSNSDKDIELTRQLGIKEFVSKPLTEEKVVKYLA